MPRRGSPRIGLVLGAGGVMGGAWLTGGLEALARETGWDPGGADYIVGTSAGSMMGALLAAGVPPWFMVAHSAGRSVRGVQDPRRPPPRGGGRGVPFGRADAPPADLADAVAASCAIPGFYPPVTIGGRRYVDGGLYSTSNLDLLRDEGLDLVICLNPTSTLYPMRAGNPAE